jgi:hypothetical protein
MKESLKIISAITAFCLLSSVFTPATASSQIVTRRPREDRNREQDWSAQPRTWVGGSLSYASPQGEFKNYVDGAVGINGHLIHQFGDGIVAFRADVGYLLYGSATRRQSLGQGAFGLVAMDVTTSNNILNGGVGMQLMAPTGSVRPYINGNLGFSYFFTESSIAGSDYDNEPFASSNNFDDGGFSTTWGGGFYVPIKMAIKNPIILDIGFTSHSNSDMRYLTKESIYIADANSTPVITPVRSAANFMTFKLGVTIGVR